MAITNSDLFFKANEQLKKNMESSFTDFTSEISILLLRLEILNDISDDILKNIEPIKVLNEINYDLYTSIYLALNGFYRNSFISLRSAAELGLGFYYFVDYNYHYQKWKLKKYDLKWSVLTKEKNGILSKTYFDTYLHFENQQKLINDYKSTYRFCSESVHGKYSFMHTLKSPKIEYESESFKTFNKEFINLTNYLFAFFAIRFTDLVTQLKEDKYQFIIENLKHYSLNTLMPLYGK